MRFSVLAAVSAPFLMLLAPAVADSQADLDRCKFVGELNKADDGIAACDRVVNDAKISAQDRAGALSSRCGWWWAKKDSDRALTDCNEAIRINRNLAPAYLNRGNVYLSKSDLDHAFTDFNEALRLDPKNAWAYAERGNLYKNRETSITRLSISMKRSGSIPATPWPISRAAICTRARATSPMR